MLIFIAVTLTFARFLRYISRKPIVRNMTMKTAVPTPTPSPSFPTYAEIEVHCMCMCHPKYTESWIKCQNYVYFAETTTRHIL